MLQRKPTLVQLPQRDAQILAKYERRAKKFDEMIKVCCCWIGYDVLLDLIPVVGKIISLAFSLSMFRTACKADLPSWLKRKMLTNISLDFLLGLIPILGIVLTMLYRANTKNARALRRFLYQRAAENEKASPPTAQQTTETSPLPATQPPPTPPRLEGGPTPDTPPPNPQS